MKTIGKGDSQKIEQIVNEEIICTTGLDMVDRTTTTMKGSLLVSHQEGKKVGLDEMEKITFLWSLEDERRE